MQHFKDLAIENVTRQLPRRDWVIGRRSGKPTSATIHYEGSKAMPVDPVKERRLLANDAAYHIQKNWGSDPRKPVYGNGLMYHFNVLSDGSILQSRELDEVLWHCGNKTGNANSIAIHLPIGGAQQPTRDQLNALWALCDGLIEKYNWAGRHHIFGHCEWPRANGPARLSRIYRPLAGQSLCPGRVVHTLLSAYRESSSAARLLRVVVPLGDFLNIREAPTAASAVLGKIANGARVYVVDGRAGWLKLADAPGYIAERYTEPLI